MGTFGPEFVNVSDFLAANGTNGREAIVAAIHQVGFSLPLGGGDERSGVLYFGPRDYLIQILDASAIAPPSWFPPNPAHPERKVDLYVPARIRLMFAPGARLVLNPGVVFDMEGSIDAEVQTIFKIVRPDVGTVTAPAVVLFTSNQVEELVPEWFGADGSSPLNDSTEALQACLDAAHRDRQARSPRSLRPSIPVRFHGTYFIRQMLEIGGRSDYHGVPLHYGVTLRTDGIVGTGNVNRPNLAPVQAPAFRGDALLKIDGAHGSVLDGVSFKGTDGSVATGLWLTGNATRVQLRRCSFSQFRRQGLLLGNQPENVFDTVAERLERAASPQLPTTAQPSSADSASSDLSGLLLDGCRFDTDIVGLVVRSPSLLPYGILFRANRSLPITVRNCLFGGGSAALIIAYGGAMVVEGCQFHNTAAPSERARRRDWSSALVTNIPQGGSDFFLADPAQDSPEPTTGLLAVQVESQSWQFLDTFKRAALRGGETYQRSVTLHAVRHGNVAGGATVRSPPAVDWYGPGIARALSGLIDNDPAELVIVACTFRTSRPGRDDLDYSGRVLVPSNVYKVIDVGTRAEYRPTGDGSETLGSRVIEPIVYGEENRFTVVRSDAPPAWLKRL